MKTLEQCRAEDSAYLEAVSECYDYAILSEMSMEQNRLIILAEESGHADALRDALERKVALRRAMELVGQKYLDEIGYSPYV